MNEQKLNEWLASRKQLRKERNADILFEGIRSGNRAILSGAITLLESSLETDNSIASELIRRCLPYSGNSVRVGITGVPGVGKSSFIEEFGKEILKEGKKIAVLAIDPSSERSGGSILGDKTRMQELSQQDRVFIRPSAAGAALGGVARKTHETIILCEAAGYDVVLIETVGVGQSEIMVHSMTDFFLLLLLTGAGDELQGIKRGIMEMADGLAVTKADGENKQRAKLAQRELKNALHLFPPSPNGWIPEVHVCSSLEKKELDTIWQMIQRFVTHTRANGTFDKKRHRQDRYRMHESLKQLLLDGLYKHSSVSAHLASYEEKVVKGELSPFEAAEKLYALYRE